MALGKEDKAGDDGGVDRAARLPSGPLNTQGARSYVGSTFSLLFPFVVYLAVWIGVSYLCWAFVRSAARFGGFPRWNTPHFGRDAMRLVIGLMAR